MLRQVIDFGAWMVVVRRWVVWSWKLARLIGLLVRILAAWQARQVWKWCDDLYGDIRRRGWRGLVTPRPSLIEQVRAYQLHGLPQRWR